MRVTVLGGTRFIGRAIVGELVGAGHDVTAVHRGQTEPAGLPPIPHIHLPRAAWTEHRDVLAASRPEAVVDCMAMTRAGADAALAWLPEDVHLVLISSQDVYRAFASLQTGRLTDPVPVDETSPLRADRFPVGGAGGPDAYSKLEVEERFMERRATVLRLPATYGEHDPQRREDFILRRLRAGRRRIPVGPGGLVWTRAWVRDIALGVRLAVERPEHGGEVFNLGEAWNWPVRLWAERIIEAAGGDAELVTVADAALPGDLEITGSTLTQHVLTSSEKARRLLGYTDTDPLTALRASVAWHLEHPPDSPLTDCAADEAALDSVPS